MLTTVLKRWPYLACPVLSVIGGCGGQVVVDHDDRAEEERFAKLCVDYCELARASDSEFCQRYDRCLERCTGDFAEARAVGCVQEMLVWYDCFTAVLNQGGFCDAACHEAIAYKECFEAHEGK